jgi:hypothetical protein
MAGCSKRPAITPAHPWRAKTRPFPSKAAQVKQAPEAWYSTHPPKRAKTRSLPWGYVEN